MKKLFAILASALTLFALASCNPEDPEKPDDNKQPDKVIPTLTLSAANISVAGIDGESFAVVDMAAKTIKINLEYVDKENARALTVSFLGLPEGVTAQYQKTFDYSNGATQTVAFNYEEEKIAEFVMGVVVAAPDPKFVTLTVGGRNAIGGEVHLPRSADLSSLAVDFTVSPTGTVVTVGGEEVAPGDELDFSDKVNGVTFTLTCGEVVNTLNVKANISGYSKVTRVWAHYAQPKNVEDDWFQTVATDIPFSGKFWLRTCAMDDQYLYVAQHQGAAYPAYVLSLADGSLVGRLSIEGVDGTGTTHALSCIRTLPDGNGGYVILQCCLQAGNGPIKVYKWDNKDATPTKVLEYTNSDGLRIGDKMGVSGTWKNGEISFLAASGNPRKVYSFAVTDGVVSAAPAVLPLPDWKDGGSYGEIVRYDDTELLAVAAGSLPKTYKLSGSEYSQTLDFDSSIFTVTDEGFTFFTFNYQKYMAFTRLTGDLCDASLRIMALNGDTLAEAVEAIDPNAVYKCGLSDPEEFPISGYKSGNSLADCTVGVVNGETLIVAMSEGAGISLFKLEE